MTASTTSRASALFTSKSFVVTLAGGLAMVLLSWTLSTHVFFGQGFLGLLGMVFGPFIAAILLFGGLEDEAHKINRPGALLGMCGAVAVGLILFSTSSDAQISMRVGHVKNTLANAAENMGAPAAIAAEFYSATKDAKTARANSDMVEDLMRATSQEQVVVNYIAAARQFGLDAGFVSSNGIVRQKDRQTLYRRALDLSSQGNQQAVRFLQNKEAIALL